MLQPGDQILYIDSTCLKNKSLEEISQMLKGNEEIVKLKIKKDEVFTGIITKLDKTFLLSRILNYRLFNNEKKRQLTRKTSFIQSNWRKTAVH